MQSIQNIRHAGGLRWMKILRDWAQVCVFSGFLRVELSRFSGTIWCGTGTVRASSFTPFLIAALTLPIYPKRCGRGESDSRGRGAASVVGGLLDLSHLVAGSQRTRAT